jgi:dihydrofolate reductase
MKTYERIFLLVLFGAILPLILFLAGLLGGKILQVPDSSIFIFALSGLLIGILADFFFIGRLIDKAYKLKNYWVILGYAFYSVLFFGFFMGVPVFNVGMALVGGFFIGRKLFHKKINEDEIKAEAKKFALFTTLVLFIICVASATIALTDKYTASGIQGMLASKVTITNGHLWGIIVVGGLILLVVNYFLSIKIVTQTFSISHKIDKMKDPAANKQISIIVAIAENHAIGKDNKLLWHISEDLKRFKKITAGHAVVMGKKTYESLPIKPLPNRQNIVITDVPGEQIDGCIMAYSIDDALTKLEEHKESFVIGGASIYQQFFKVAQKLYITRVHATYDADTFFPEISDSEWVITETEQPKEKNADGIKYSFVTYSRKK